MWYNTALRWPIRDVSIEDKVRGAQVAFSFPILLKIKSLGRGIADGNTQHFPHIRTSLTASGSNYWGEE